MTQRPPLELNFCTAPVCSLCAPRDRRARNANGAHSRHGMRPELMLDLLETGLVAVPALALAYRLSAAGFLSEAVLLPTLCAAAVLQMRRQGPASEAGQACSCRPKAAPGVALGCVSPALLLGGLLLVRTRAEAPLGTLRVLLVAALVRHTGLEPCTSRPRQHCYSHAWAVP